MIIVASCLDEKLTFSEDSSGTPSEEIRLSCFKGEQPFFPFAPPPRPSLLLSVTHLMSMDFMRSFSAFEL